MWDRRWLLGFGLALGAVLVAPSPGSAGVLDASWTAPSTNTDGSPLIDLASYRLYYGASAPPCPGVTFVQVPSSTSTPSASQTVTSRLTGLTTGTLYNVSLTAVDSAGLESACSTGASAVAQVDFAVTPTATVNFGNVNIGSVLDQVFTVQNTRGGTVTGTASVSAPFSIGSGSPFTLVGASATQTVTVRFAPTSTAVASTNVSFAADGDTRSSIVTGTGVSTSSTSTLTVSTTGTGSGTVTSSPAGTVNAAPPVTATFAAQSVTLVVAKSGTGGPTVTGTEVTFYNTWCKNSTSPDACWSVKEARTAGPFLLGGGGSQTLSAPTTGAMKGVLFFTDRAADPSIKNDFSGGSSICYTGAIYCKT